MEPMSLVVEDHPAAQDIEFLSNRINEFNFAATQIYDGSELAIFIRDSAGQVVAGVYGWTWGRCGYIDKLWVHADMRGRGYGTQLLQAAEREIIARSCGQVLLCTHSFQAPAFYVRFGYTVYGEIDNYPQGYKQLYFKKMLI
jgi:ribosomal protein S18 acetylase RimI-like enzyme